jgi:hypothetical protein
MNYIGSVLVEKCHACKCGGMTLRSAVRNDLFMSHVTFIDLGVMNAILRYI